MIGVAGMVHAGRLVGTDLARFPEARLWPAKGTCPVIRLIRQLNANRFVEARPRSGANTLCSILNIRY